MRASLLESQIFILMLSLLWGVYFVALWRTQTFGTDWRSLLSDALVVLLSVLPIAVLGVLGLPLRRAAVVLSALSFLIILVVEALAGIQERLAVQRYGADPGRQVFVERWPPFGNHFIAFSPGHGWIGGD